LASFSLEVTKNMI